MIPAEVEDEIVRLRKELPLDRGAHTIAYHLGRGGWPVLSVATIHRVLRRRGLVRTQPEKRPRSSWHRFEWLRPNDAWQIDATCWALSSGTEVWAMDLLDDHSRLAVAARACGGPSSDAAWTALCDAAELATGMKRPRAEPGPGEARTPPARPTRMRSDGMTKIR